MEFMVLSITWMTSSHEHYLDDFFTCGDALSTECAANLQQMLLTCADLGFSVQPTKVQGPTTELEFLGIVVDSVKMDYVSQKKGCQITDLCEFQGKRSFRKRDLLTLIEKLNFVSKVVRSGRTFIRRLIECSKKAHHLHHKVKLTKFTRLDIEWWLSYLPVWNGVIAMFDPHWTSNAELHLWTDISDTG